MSNQDQTENQATGSELDKLKSQAKELGLQFHPNMGQEKLQKKVDQAIEAQVGTVSVEPAREILTVSEITELQQLRAEKTAREATIAATPSETTNQRTARMIKDARKLVRIVVTCMNPNKRDWEGEMYTVSNSIVSESKFVPFNNEEGWHVPQILLDHMQDRECQIFYTKKNSRGDKTKHGKLIKELGIRILPPLSLQELDELAQRQAMAAGTST